MQHPINPTNDFVIHQLFALPENRDLLIHFLNSLLQLDQPIVAVQLLNPNSVAETLSDKTHVLDIKAIDQTGRTFQVELQVQVPYWLPERMLHNWAELYQSQLEAGDEYEKLQPTISIWIMVENLFKAAEPWHHHFRLYDPDHRRQLSDHLAIHTLELRKWRRPTGPLAPAEEWIYFFKEAKRWTALPPEITTPELKKAMSVLERISQRQIDYWRYKDREEAMRVQRSIELERQENQKQIQAQQEQLEANRLQLHEQQEQLHETQQQLHEQQEQLAARERELDTHRREVEALRAKLLALGLDPDAL